MSKSIITVANEQVDIRLVCALIGVELPEIPDGKSVKVRCPFGWVYHPDGGAETAFRVYPHTNSAFCFACNEYFSPVSLASKALNKTWEEAAVELLDRIGYKPVSLAQAWSNVVHHETPPDTAMLGVALKTYCAREDSNWQDDQFDAYVAKWLDKCLSLLARVSNEEEARSWLETSKAVMKRVLLSRSVSE